LFGVKAASQVLEIAKISLIPALKSDGAGDKKISVKFVPKCQIPLEDPHKTNLKFQAVITLSSLVLETPSQKD